MQLWFQVEVQSHDNALAQRFIPNRNVENFNIQLEIEM